MLKSVLLFVGLVLAVALAVPSLLPSPAERAESATTARPAPAPSPPASTDHGGIVRLAADRNGHYVTDIEINYRRLPALVDTGATVIALRYEDARSLGLVSPGDKFDVGVRTANGIGRARKVELRSVRLGSITIRDVEALVMEQGALGANLLGMSFLKRLSRFEVQRGQLVLER
jgi:aspartyl protease family protein